MSLLFGVIANPRSRRNRRDPEGLVRLEQAAQPHGRVERCEDEAQLRAALVGFREARVQVIAVSGGDGTNHMVLTHALQVYGDVALPKFAFLRGGTMNTVARALGIRARPPLRLLMELGRALARGTRLQTTSRHCLIAGDEAGFLFGAGAVHGFLAEYYRNGDPSPEVALKTLARGVASALTGGDAVARIVRPFRGSVTLASGETWPNRDYLAIAAGTVAQIGLGFKPFYRCDEDIHVLGIFASAASFVAGLPRVRVGAPLGPSRCYDTVTAEFTLKAADGPIDFMVDGDLRQATGPLVVRRGPRITLVTAAA